MDLKITFSSDTIIFDSDSYVLLRESRELYERFESTFEKYMVDVKKFKIHEQLLDVMVFEINKFIPTKFDYQEDSIHFFGLPVEIIKK